MIGPALVAASAVLVAAAAGGVTATAPQGTSRGAAEAARAAAASAPTVRDTIVAPVARDPALEERTVRLAAELRCPVCQGLSIQDSPAQLSQQMLALVREQVASGKTDDEVKAYFVGRYGEWILLKPKPTGFNLFVYVLPALALVGGAVVIARAVRKWTAAPPSSS